MSNVVQLPTPKQYSGIAHRVVFDMVPRAIVEKLFHAAIAVGWAADEDEYRSENAEAVERMKALMDAVSAASEFTVPVDHQTGAPRANEHRALRGICSDCGGPSKKWTAEEIQAAKDDLGMTVADDFADCCEQCGKKYLPS